MAVISALAVFASIAAFVTIYSSADHEVTVLIVAHSIQRGQLFTSSDLSQTEASISSGVTPIPVTDASQLSGKRASVTLPAGSLLTPADVSSGEQIAAGYAVVGLSLKDGQLPSGGVVVGDDVMVVQTASPGTPVSVAGDATSDGGTGVLVPDATVYGIALPSASSSSDSQLVSVEVASTVSAAVATAAAAGQVSLVLLPSGSAGQSAGSMGGSSTDSEPAS